ncbi:hypothetical protein [Luteipulveratus halotolerans]|uniref:PKD domain-containing protein n=1 Tax=Luteipulveratus halotolerans TaxID=1631356 RepID=A0A0L6CEC1_9MICO|nr:hypothetical protein [Luteipulveratus halotolerans]KNX36014.1 hypothetical protein VV01_00755 [Luteipulveratus halotolerans]
MNHDLEQRLRDAFEAHAAQVTPDRLDSAREHDMRRQLAVVTPIHQRWRTVAMVGGGIAAAALVAGTVVMAGGLGRDHGAVAADPTLAVSPTSGPSGTGTALGTAAPTTAPSDTGDGTPSLAQTRTQDRTSYVPAPPRDTGASRSMTSSEEPSPSTTDEPTPTSTSTSTTSEPTTTSTVESNTTKMTAASGPAHLSITPSVSVTSPQATVSFTYSGDVHPATSGGVEPTFTQITFGDGQQAGSDGGGTTCDGSAPTRPMSGSFPRGTNTYASPGTYTITFTVGYCGDAGPTTASVKRTITIEPH